jgi:hypothetical protein
MSKATITRLFVGGVVAVLAGLVLAIAGVWAAFVGGVFVMDGPDVTGINGGSAAWTTFALMILGGLAVMGGALAGLVSWIGALMNTAQLDDKVWFIVLLVLGLFSFGVLAMIGYVIAGPDGTQAPTARSLQPLPHA